MCVAGAIKEGGGDDAQGRGGDAEGVRQDAGGLRRAQTSGAALTDTSHVSA